MMITDKITITHEDNKILMSRYPDNYFDLAIVDPPYGINAANMQMGSNPKRSKNDGFGSGPSVSTAVKSKKGRLNSGGGHFKGKNLTTMNCDWDNAIPDLEYFEELKRVSKNQVIWGGNYFPLPPTRGILVWDKKQAWDNFSQVELAWTSFDYPAKLYRLSNTGGANDQDKIHPTQKPIPLYKYVLSKYAKKGDKILDTHLGSGTIAIACHDYGFELTACELDVNYYNSAIDKIKKHVSQQKLIL
jgi:site-specific DNA-methyltransferase (adenine-specific)